MTDRPAREFEIAAEPHLALEIYYHPFAYRGQARRRPERDGGAETPGTPPRSTLTRRSCRGKR